MSCTITLFLFIFEILLFTLSHSDESFVYGQCWWERTNIDFNVKVFCNLGYIELPSGGATPTSINSPTDGDPLNTDECDDCSDIDQICINAGFDDQYFYCPIGECVAVSSAGITFSYIRYVVDFEFDNAGPFDMYFGHPQRNPVSLSGGTNARLEFIIDMNNGNTGGPVASTIGTNPIEFTLGIVNIIALTPVDPDIGDIITCRKATTVESIIDDNSFYDIDEMLCEISINVNGNEGDMYAMQIMMVSDNGDENSVDFTLIGINGNDASVDTCESSSCEASSDSICDNSPGVCDCDNVLNCHICHENVGCSQCESGYWKIDYDYNCIECNDDYVGQGCIFCQDFHGCGQCEQGYTRVFDSDCNFWICQ